MSLGITDRSVCVLQAVGSCQKKTAGGCSCPRGGCSPSPWLPPTAATSSPSSPSPRTGRPSTPWRRWSSRTSTDTAPSTSPCGPCSLRSVSVVTFHQRVLWRRGGEAERPSLARILGECSIFHSPPALFFFSFEVEINSRTLIPLFRPGSVHSGSAS